VSQSVDFFSQEWLTAECGGEKLKSGFESHRPKLQNSVLSFPHPVLQLSDDDQEFWNDSGTILEQLRHSKILQAGYLSFSNN
jgi:hypothetical protein